MNRDDVKRTVEKAKDKTNEAVAYATDEPQQKLNGDVEQAHSEARQQVGHLKDAIDDPKKDC